MNEVWIAGYNNTPYYLQQFFISAIKACGGRITKEDWEGEYHALNVKIFYKSTDNFLEGLKHKLLTESPIPLQEIRAPHLYDRLIFTKK